MPFNPVSDRQAATAYAIDLLRAHQLRRENVLLHEKLTACSQEVGKLQDEIKALKAESTSNKEVFQNLELAQNASEAAVQKLSAQAVQHEDRYEDQRCELDTIQQSLQDAKSQISDLRTLATKIQGDDQKAVRAIDDGLKALREDHENFMSSQQRYVRQSQLALESFGVVVEEKADISQVEALERRLDKVQALAVPQKPLRAVSQVSESVQVPDSQSQRQSAAMTSSPRSPFKRSTHAKPAETVPEDLDLDANAETISYAGHLRPHPYQHDSLRILPDPPAPASQLERVKTLRQRKFDDWTSYYKQGQAIMGVLPSSFEETVVHNFVDGMFRESHKKQCRQWLDARGWTWANVTTFGNLCLQIQHDITSRIGDEQDSGAGAKTEKPGLAADEPCDGPQRLAEKRSDAPNDEHQPAKCKRSNLRPMLVPKDNRDPGAKDSSEDENFLLEDMQQKRDSSKNARGHGKRPVKYTARSLRQRKGQAKKPWLQRSPPPEIPILSTTDEE
jgi:hypothetical protein